MWRTIHGADATVAMGYRSYAIGSHAIFYRTRSAGVDVIRILHQRMDPSRHV